MLANATLLAVFLSFPTSICDDWDSGQQFIVQDEVPDNRDEVKALLDELAELVSRSGREDPGDKKAVSLINRLKREFNRSGKHDKSHIIRGMERMMLARRKAHKDGSVDTALFIEAARALGPMGEEASKPLLKWIDNKRHRDDLALQRELILSLGLTRSKLARKELTKILKDRRPTFLAAAATGLGQFTHESSKIRKEIFENLMKALIQAESNARGQDSTATSIWAAINGPASSSMRKLSGASAGSPEQWQHWWNKNKRRDWDE